MMTNAEVKVKELADVLREKIYAWREGKVSPEIIVDRIDAYLSGVGDGIDFCDTMRHAEQQMAKVDPAYAHPFPPAADNNSGE